MAEDINQALGIEPQNNNQEEVNNTSQDVSTGDDNSAENTLNVIAYIVLVFGVIAGLICLFSICWIEDPRYHYHTKYIFNPTGFATTVAIFLSSIASWAIMRVLSNISKLLKEIKNK